MIDREITSQLSTLDRQPFVDATVTEELSVFSSQTNFLNTKQDKVYAALSFYCIEGNDTEETFDQKHNQIIWSYQYLITHISLVLWTKLINILM